MRALPAAVMVVCISGCGCRSSPGAACDWPQTHSAVLLDLARAADLRHLSDDAEMAEDLAIRHADAQRGRRSGRFAGISEYRRVRDECMATLFADVAATHAVTANEVRESLGRRRVSVDALVIGSFGVLYAFCAGLVASRLLRSPLSDRGWRAAIVIVVASAFVSGAAVGAGGVWSGLWEIVRIGNDHLSYRAARLPWGRYLPQLFGVGVVLFWIVAAFQYRAKARCGSRS